MTPLQAGRYRCLFRQRARHQPSPDRPSTARGRLTVTDIVSRHAPPLRKRSGIISIKAFQKRPLPRPGYQHRWQARLRHNGNSPPRARHNRSQRHFCKELCLSFIQPASLFFRGRSTELPAHQQIDCRGPSASFISKKLFGNGLDTGLVAHTFPSLCMARHRIVQHSVHIEKNRLEQQAFRAYYVQGMP